jgi:hypothetical protein
VADHEGHLLLGDALGGDDEVGFVLAGGVVEDDEEFTVLCTPGGSVSVSAILTAAWGGSVRKRGNLLKDSMQEGMESN